MTNDDIRKMMGAVAPVFAGYVSEALSPIAARIDAIEQRFNAMPVPVDGKSITVDDVSPLIIATIREELKTVPEMVTAEVATAVGRIELPVNGKDADPEVVAGIVAERMAGELEKVHAILEALPEPEELPDVAGMIAEAVAAVPVPVSEDSIKGMIDAAVAAIPEPRHGKDADPEEMAALVLALVSAEVEKAIAALPKPQDGRSVEPEELRPLVEEAVSAAFSALPVPKNGVDGKDADVEEIAARLIPEVERAVAAIPIPKDGRDGIDGKDGKNGIGLAGGVIDRNGELVLTLTDGKSQALGVIVGKDADMAEIERQIAEKVAAIPLPKNGVDGLSFADFNFDVEFDGERTFTLKWSNKDKMRTAEFTIPTVLDQGVFKEGQTYKKGDGVTWGGHYWIAQDETVNKPDSEKSGWRMAVRRGRDGKPGKDGELKKPPAPVKSGAPK